MRLYIKHRIRGFGRWFRAGWPLWVFVAGFLAAFELPLIWVATLRQQVVSAGVLLELLGLFTVGLGLMENRKLFGLRTVLGAGTDWIRSLPKSVAAPKRATGRSNITIPMAKIHGRGYATEKPGHEATVDERLGAIERNIERIHKRITNLQHEHDSLASKTEAREEVLRREITGELRRVDERLKEFGTGSLAIESVGFAWLLVGLLLANFPGAAMALAP